jgi:hypothetical protein
MIKRIVISAALAAMLVLGASVLAQESGEKHKATNKEPRWSFRGVGQPVAAIEPQ